MAPFDVWMPHEGGRVPLVAAMATDGGAARVHLRDRRQEVDLQTRLARALAAPKTERRQERGIDGRHRALLASMTEAVAVIDAATGRIVETTAAAASLLGGTAAGLVGAAFTQCFEGRRRSEFTDALVAAALFGDGMPAFAELRQGRGRVDIRPALIRAAEDTVLVCRMTQAGGRSADGPDNAALRLLARTCDGIACLDADGVVTRANATFVAMTGTAAAARPLGRSLAGLLMRGALDPRALAAPDRPATLATQIVAEDGRRLPVEITAAALGGWALGLIARDLTLADVTQDGASTPRAGVGAETAALVGSAPLRDIVAATTDGVEQSCIEAALALTGDTRGAATEMLGLSRQGLYVKLRKFGLADRAEP